MSLIYKLKRPLNYDYIFRNLNNIAFTQKNNYIEI